MRIMIVDDSPINLTMAHNLISKLGYDSDNYESSAKAYEAAACMKYDIIFTDFLMPEMDGIELTKQLRKLGAYRETPIVMITSGYTVEEYNSFINAGVSKILNKPFSIDDLRTTFDEFFNNSADETDVPDEALTDSFDDEYSELVSIFYDNARDRINNIRQFLEAGDLEGYTIEVHGVKGEANMISAEELSSAAHTLEMAGKALCGIIPSEKSQDELRSFIDNNTGPFLDLFEDTLIELSKILESSPQTANAKEENATPVPKESSELLAKVNRYAAHALEALEGGDLQLTKNWLLEIKEIVTL